MKLKVDFETPLCINLKVDMHHHQEAAPYKAITTFSIGPFVFKGEHMSNTMQVGTYATLSVEWKDKGGNTVKVDGPTNWTTTDDTVCTVTVSSGNPQIANLYAPGTIGHADLHATADADLGDGVKTVTAVTGVDVIEGQAVSGDITFTQSPEQAQPGPSKPGGAARPHK